MITVVVTPEQLVAPQVELIGDVYRHLFRARRLGPDASLRLVDGQGQARQGRLGKVGRRSAQVLLGESLPSREARRVVRVFVGTPRLERAAWLVEKLTELGVRSVHFLPSERAQKSLLPGALAKLARRAKAAVEQCHRARVPLVENLDRLEDASSWISQCDVAQVLALGPGSTSLPLESLKETDKAPSGESSLSQRAESVALLVGPEGGFSPAEEERLVAMGSVRLDLGERVLRVETAAVVAASRWLAFPGV